MSDAPMTISVLAGLETDASKSGLTDADRAKLAAKLREHAHEVVALKPYDVGPRLVELLTESLRKPVAGILGEVWKQRKELREAAAKGTGPKTVKADVELIEHSMTWTLKPSITVKVTAAPAPVPSATLAVDVDVTLELHG